MRAYEGVLRYDSSSALLTARLFYFLAVVICHYRGLPFFCTRFGVLTRAYRFDEDRKGMKDAFPLPSPLTEMCREGKA